MSGPKKNTHNQKESSQKEIQKVSMREFLNISKWIFKTVFFINPWLVIIHILFTIFKNMRTLINSYIFAKIIDHMIFVSSRANAEPKDIIPMIGLLIAINLIFAVLDFFSSYSDRQLYHLLRMRQKQLLYTKVYSLGIQSLENPETTNKVFRSRETFGQIHRYYQQIGTLISHVVTGIASLVIIANFAPLLVPVLIVLSIPKWLLDKKYRGLSWKLDVDYTESNRKANESASKLTYTPAMHEVFINNAFGFLDKKFMSFQRWFIGQKMNILKKWFTGLHATSFIANIGVFVGFFYIFANFMKKLVTIGNVTFQINTLTSFTVQISGFFNLFNNLFEFSMRMKDPYELFLTEPEFKDGDVVMEKLERGPEVEFRNLNFMYPRTEKLVLQDINLKINSGEKIALVGPNGAGKTTLVKLICRMYETPEGDVLVNGKDIDGLNTGAWLQNVGVLFQDFNMYEHLNVQENIFIGKSDSHRDKDDIIEAAKKAEALEFIEDFPKSFDQTLSVRYKKGIRPSTGQWQKIAIARFFYRNAPLVVFDEPTASIDAESEFNIFNRIYKYFKGKTVIIISHRYSTVRNADRIIVLDKGRIIEEGSHNELMKKNGKYAKSFLLQAKGYETEPVSSIK